MNESFKTRMATFSDIETLSNHHIEMFKEVREKQGKFYSEES
jgi:hypothetical protein